jgi:hypothetical protein
VTLAAGAASAQSPSGPPIFEVASVKPGASGGRGMSLSRGAGGGPKRFKSPPRSQGPETLVVDRAEKPSEN